MQDVIPQWDQLPALNWKEKIAYLGRQFKQGETTECPLKHIFEGDQYIREMFIPAGTLFLGREHKKGHECHLVQGSIILVSPDGRSRLDAPFGVMTTPGYHMVFYAITDVVGRTVHPAHGSQDIVALEDEYFGTSEELDELGETVHLRLTQQ